ncbi:hypothetical protein [Microbulbifer variabilis]|nr:hypothetical protein [Microbulbifer variabilis]
MAWIGISLSVLWHQHMADFREHGAGYHPLLPGADTGADGNK